MFILDNPEVVCLKGRKKLSYTSHLCKVIKWIWKGDDIIETVTSELICYEDESNENMTEVIQRS